MRQVDPTPEQCTVAERSKTLSDREVEDLVLAAQEARQRAYCPYSKFAVGAALLTEDGHVVKGCNVENISSGLTICAERAAVCAAVVQGHRNFKAIAIVGKSGDSFVSPCGACRQVLAEFGTECEVYLANLNNEYVKSRIGKYLPDGFTPNNIQL